MSQSTKMHRCLYATLEVEKTADVNVIRKAYKVQARIWHPDRNIDNIEEATARFKEINQAFEVLSDKHERAWYDAHRDKILRGIDPNSNIDANTDEFDLVPYFSPWAYTSFDDSDPNNYYHCYAEVFTKIANIEGRSQRKVPRFGTSKSSYIQLRKFYHYWEDFRSARDFNWCMKYKLSDAANRAIRKAMEKENKKAKNEAKKSWEDSVSRLVRFVKKRDPRFRQYLIELEKQKQEEEKKTQEFQKELDALIREERKIAREKEIQKFMEEDIPNDSFALERHLHECIACDKTFRSEAALENHQRSRKHQKTVEALREQLTLEETLLLESELLNTADSTVLSDVLQSTVAIETDTSMEANGVATKKAKTDSTDPQTKDLDQIQLDFLVAQQLNAEKLRNQSEQMQSAATKNDDTTPATTEANGTQSGDKVKELSAEEMDRLLAMQMEHEDLAAIHAVTSVATNDAVAADEDELNDDLLIATTISEKELSKLVRNGVDISQLLTSGDAQTIDPNKLKKQKRKQRRKNRRANRFANRTDNNDDAIVDNATIDVNDTNTDANTDSQPKEDGAPTDDPTNKTEAESGSDDDLKDFLERMKNPQKYKQQSSKKTDDDSEDKPKRKRRRRKDQSKAQHETELAKKESLRCKSCQTMFESKTQLFHHLKTHPSHSKFVNHNQL